MSDIDMLTVLSDPLKFERYYPHVRGNMLTEEGETVLKFMHEYLQEGKTEFDWDHFAAWFLVKNSMFNFEKKDNYRKIFAALKSKPAVDADFTRKILRELTTKSFAGDIAKKAQAISDGANPAKGIDDLEDAVEQAQTALLELTPDDDPTLAPKTLDFLTSGKAKTFVIKPSLKRLQDAYEGITKGDLIVVGAHPNTGKTTFLLGEVSYALKQLPKDQHILYFNNEQAMQKMQLRLVSAVLHRDRASILADPIQANKDFIAAGGDRIHLYDKSYMSTKYVEERLKRHHGKIGLILFDQLWKISGASRSNNDFMQLAHQFAWARDIAKTHSPVICAHQADGDSMGKTKYLTMDHLFGSRIAIQGEADLIITIGRLTDGSQRPDVRHLHIPKNKLDPGNDPSDREPKFDAFVDHEHVCFKDVS